MSNSIPPDFNEVDQTSDLPRPSAGTPIEQFGTLTVPRAVAANEGQIVGNVDVPREETEERVAKVIQFGDGVKRLKKREADLKKSRKPKRKPRAALPKVNGITDQKGPYMKKIAAGKIAEESVPKKIDAAFLIPRADKSELVRAAEITGALENTPLNLEQATRALFALTHGEAAEDFDELNRDQKFQKVAEILVRIWSHNYLNRLDDRRVEDCIRLVTGKEPFGRISSVLQNFATLPLRKRGHQK